MGKLAYSFFVLVAFYVSLALTFWVVFLGDFFFLQEEFNLEEGLSFSKIIHVLTTSVTNWTIPSLLLISATFAFGILFSLVISFFKRKKGKKLSAPGKYNGIKSSIGQLPMPDWNIKRGEPVELVFDENINKIYSTFKPEYQSLFSEIIGVLNDHPETEVGPGHKGTIVEHTINVLLNAYNSNHKSIYDPLAFIAIAAHDVGKIFSGNPDEKFKEQFWVRNGHHDEFSGLILSTCSSFMKIPSSEQKLLIRLIKYNHKPNKVPAIEDPVERARYDSIFSLLKGSDQRATKVEKEEILAEMEIPEIFNRIFWRAFKKSKFMTRSVNPGTQVDAFKFNEDTVLLIENKFRDRLLAEMNETEKAVFNKGKRSNRQLSLVTVELIKYLSSKQLLVQEYEKKKSKSGLWNILTGTLKLSGALMVKIPEEYRGAIDDAENKYELSIDGPTHIFDRDAPKKRSKQSAEEVKKAVAPRERGKKTNPEQPAKNEAVKSETKAEPPKPQQQAKAKPLSRREIVRKKEEKKEAIQERRKERNDKYRPKETVERNKENLEILESVNKVASELEQKNMEAIKRAEERLKDKSLSYEEAKAELDFLIAMKRLEINSPYYIAKLSNKGDLSSITAANKNAKTRSRKVKKVYKDKSCSLISASIMSQ